jgi:hypothetical protein
MRLPAWWRAAPASSRASPARRAPPRAARCRRRAASLDVPCRCARTDAGAAIGRAALGAGTVPSGASIKPDEPGETLHREPLDTADVPCPSTCRAAAPGPMPVAQSVATRRAGMARWPAAPGRPLPGKAAVIAAAEIDPKPPSVEPHHLPTLGFNNCVALARSAAAPAKSPLADFAMPRSV